MLLGLDLGTASAKALLVSEDGGVLGEGSAAYAVRSPRPGWAETAPDEWWDACTRAVRSAVGDRGGRVLALGLSGQMHGVVLADENGEPLRPAVLWADTRSADRLGAYRALREDLTRTLANPLAAGMAGPSLLWLRDEEPDVYGAARWALQPKDWLRLRLTGEAAAEPSDASATLLYDVGTDAWSEPTVEALGLRAELLAPIRPSVARAGELSAAAAEHLGLAAGLPVAAGAGDTAAAALGTGMLEPGRAQLTVGTGGQVLAPKTEPGPDPRLRTHLYRAAHDGVRPGDPTGRFYAMAAIQNAGLALEWVLKVFGVSWETAYREAFSVASGSEGVVFLPYLSGERTPHLDPGARGAWVGLGLGSERANLLRAAFEGVAFALRDGLAALEAAGTRARELRLAGGGTMQKPWRQLLADALGRELLVLPDAVATRASARGAAFLGGVASGLYGSVADTLAFAPAPVEAVRPGVEDLEETYARYREVYPGLRRDPGR